MLEDTSVDPLLALSPQPLYCKSCLVSTIVEEQLHIAHRHNGEVLSTSLLSAALNGFVVCWGPCKGALAAYEQKKS
jgi:hypothetical protein